MWPLSPNTNNWMCLMALWQNLLTCGCQGTPPRCPWSCFSHLLPARSKWSALQAVAHVQEPAYCGFHKTWPPQKRFTSHSNRSSNLPYAPTIMEMRGLHLRLYTYLIIMKVNPTCSVQTNNTNTVRVKSSGTVFTTTIYIERLLSVSIIISNFPYI